MLEVVLYDSGYSSLLYQLHSWAIAKCIISSIVRLTAVANPVMIICLFFAVCSLVILFSCPTEG